MSIAYRREIDGLRALAIIPVVLFHIGISGFSGGFVGVDIFFVISGFLITSIILRDIDQGAFSFAHFFERRIRRIFPALMVVLLVTVVAGFCIVLYPSDFAELGKSIIAQGLFLSNLFFLRNENYFAAPAESFPLLHTWTLSVEEQFYIFFPLLIVGVVIFLKRKLFPIVVAIAAFSFALSMYLAYGMPGADFSIPFIPDIVWNGASNQVAGFYLLPTRAWELMIGAMLAILGVRIRARTWAEVLSWGGICAIIYSVTQFDAMTPFPGAAAAVPVLGAAAIIVSNSGNQTMVGRILSIPIFVWIGLISYSLYLWHWPVLVYTKMFIPEPNTLQTVFLIVVPVILAWGTYRLVELPFKRKQLFPGQRSMIRAGVAALALTVGIGYGMTTLNSEARSPDYVQPLFEAERNLGDRYTECLKTKTFDVILHDGPCELGITDESQPPSFVLLGDSHAGTIVSTVDAVAIENELHGVAFLAPGCLPITNVYRPDKSPDCPNMIDHAITYIQDNNVQLVIFVSSWNHYTGATEGVFIQDVDSHETTIPESRAVFIKHMQTMIGTLVANGTQVAIMKEIPVQDAFDQRHIFNASVRAGELVRVVETTYGEHRLYNEFTDSVFAVFGRQSGVTVFDPADVLCVEGGTCRLYDGDTILYSNNDHLNLDGANLLIPLFADILSVLE